MTSRFGRSRFGGSTATLLITSVAIGLVGGLALGAIAAMLRPDDPTWVVLLVFTASTLPIVTALAWVLLVDRATLTDAPRNPGDSIESAWLDTAASGAFWDLVAAAGLGAAALTFADGAGFSPSVAPVLVGLLVLAALDVGARYLHQRKIHG